MSRVELVERGKSLKDLRTIKHMKAWLNACGLGLYMYFEYKSGKLKLKIQNGRHSL